MKNILAFWFGKNQFTASDMVVFGAAMVVGGWSGVAVLIFGVFAGSYIGGLAMAWKKDGQ